MTPVRVGDLSKEGCVELRGIRSDEDTFVNPRFAKGLIDQSALSDTGIANNMEFVRFGVEVHDMTAE
jgi:hypothetical protein